MKVRAEALIWAISRLPPAASDGPHWIAISVPKFRTIAAPVPLSATEEIQKIVFRREVFGRGGERWYEWVLDVSDADSESTYKCPECFGITGKIDRRCRLCKGTGSVTGPAS